jgi:hypothetical protein
MSERDDAARTEQAGDNPWRELPPRVQQDEMSEGQPAESHRGSGETALDPEIQAISRWGGG